jgi:hypothetical protein
VLLMCLLCRVEYEPEDSVRILPLCRHYYHPDCIGEWLQRNKVKTLWPWPARSPDLNPIEVMWRIVEERCGRAAAQTHEELQAAVQKAWDEVPQSTVDALCASFTDCLKECIKVNGELVLRNRMRASVRGQR